MKTLGIIPSRYASTRFPAKPLADIAGKSMLQRVWEQCSLSQQLDEVFVATDDDRIYEHVLSFGGKVCMTDSNHQSGTDRCGEVYRLLEEEGKLFDIIVNIQGDEPLLNPKQINDLVLFLKNTAEADLASQYKVLADTKLAENPNVVKVVTSLSGKAYTLVDLLFLILDRLLICHLKSILVYMLTRQRHSKKYVRLKLPFWNVQNL